MLQQKHCQLGLKETSERRNEKKLTDFENSTGRKQTDKTIQQQTHSMLPEKGRTTQRNESQAQKSEPRITQDYVQAPKFNIVCPAGVQNSLGSVAPFFFQFPFYY